MSDNTATLTVTEDQLRLIQNALDFYSRVGTGHTSVIKDHPTFVRFVEENRPDGKRQLARVAADSLFAMGRDQLITFSEGLGVHDNLGLFHKMVDDSCRVAYDMIQVIRHEFWKRDPNRSDVTIDSNITFIYPASDRIKVTFNEGGEDEK